MLKFDREIIIGDYDNIFDLIILLVKLVLGSLLLGIAFCLVVNYILRNDIENY